MRRIVIYDRYDEFVAELSEEEVYSAVMREEINGEHSLTIATKRVLEKGQRIRLHTIGRNAYGSYATVQRLLEFVVVGIDDEHRSGTRALGTYHCVWSLQEDLMGVPVSLMPGVRTPVLAGTALRRILEAQTRWKIHTVSGGGYGGGSMYDMSAWEALGVLCAKWKPAEVDAWLEELSDGHVQRRVTVMSMLGSRTVKHRFDFGKDMRGIKRTVSDEPTYCRVSPRGKGEQVGDGYGRKITIESVNGGRDYVELSSMLPYAELYDSRTEEYSYPTRIVTNSDCETPADLKAWALENLSTLCSPSVSYHIDVVEANLGEGGVSMAELCLGDQVQIVDTTFAENSELRLEGRVLSKTTDLLNDKELTLDVGTADETLAAQFASTSSRLGTVESRVLSYGEQLSDSTSGVSVATGTNTNVLSLTLGIGVWLVNGRVGFPVNATGRRAAKISKTSQDTANVISTVTQDAVNGALTHCSTMRCIYITGAEVAAGTNKVYLIGYQTSGESLSANGAIEATRIG